jgi:hypothetical protein
MPKKTNQKKVFCILLFEGTFTAFLKSQQKDDRRIRIQEVQNHVDPDSDPDPQHWITWDWIIGIIYSNRRYRYWVFFDLRFILRTVVSNKFQPEVHEVITGSLNFSQRRHLAFNTWVALERLRGRGGAWWMRVVCRRMGSGGKEEEPKTAFLDW